MIYLHPSATSPRKVRAIQRATGLTAVVRGSVVRLVRRQS